MIDLTNAFDLLRSQHDAIEELFAQVARAEPSARPARLRELADLLTVHTALEQEVFYPAVVRGATADLLLDAVEDHADIDRQLTDLLELDPDSIAFRGYLTLLADAVRRHARDREEGELFPAVAALLDDDELADLGAAMWARFDELESSPQVARGPDSYTLAR
jgi:hypothetical protein